MKDTKGNIITEEEFMKGIGHGVQPEEQPWYPKENALYLSKKEPEEWHRMFLDAGTYETGTDLSCMIGTVSKIISTEIRKAEEKVHTHYQTEIEAIITAYCDIPDYDTNKMVEDLTKLITK